MGSKNWQIKSLSEIAEIIGGGTPRTSNTAYWNGNIVWLSPTDLPSIGVIINVSDSKNKITKLGLEQSSARLLPKGSVVFSSRASIGKIGITDTELCTNQGFANFICSDRIYNRFLAYALRRYIPEITALSNSTTFAEVSKSSLRRFKIPVPPLLEQRRIVAKLDSLFERIDRAIGLVEENIVNAQRLMASVLNNIFEYSDWETVPFHSIVSNDTKTITPLPNEKYNIIGLENIERDTGRLIDFQPLFGKDSKSSKVIFSKGDVLYGKLRPYLNKVYVAEFDGIATTEILPFCPDTTRLSSYFLASYLRSPRFLAMVNVNCAGARMPRVTTKFWKSVMVPIPDITIQNQVCVYLDAIGKEQDKLLLKHQAQLTQLLALKSCLLDVAFKGEL